MTAVSSTLADTEPYGALLTYNWKLADRCSWLSSSSGHCRWRACRRLFLLGGGRHGGVGRGRIRVNAYRRRYYGGLLVAPAIAVLFVMNIFPLLWSLGLSFFAYQANQQTIRFVGLDNYIRILTNDLAAPATWGALINTAMFVVFTVSAQMIVGFLLAMLFAKQFPLRKYLLILVLTPMMLSVVASACSSPTTMTRHSAFSAM